MPLRIEFTPASPLATHLVDFYAKNKSIISDENVAGELLALETARKANSDAAQASIAYSTLRWVLQHAQTLEIDANSPLNSLAACMGHVSRLVAVPSAEEQQEKQKQQNKDEAFVRRTIELKKKQEDYQYASLLGNYVQKKKEEVENRSPFRSVRGQMSIGMDVILSMLTFFVLFYFASWIFSSEYTTRLVFGAAGLVIGLFIEGILLMIRGDRDESEHEEKHRIVSEATGGTIQKGGAARPEIVGRKRITLEMVQQELLEEEQAKAKKRELEKSATRLDKVLDNTIGRLLPSIKSEQSETSDTDVSESKQAIPSNQTAKEEPAARSNAARRKTKQTEEASQKTGSNVRDSKDKHA